jgi:hypothetical protein
MCVGIASFMSQWAQAGVTTYYIGGLLASAGTEVKRILIRAFKVDRLFIFSDL